VTIVGLLTRSFIYSLLGCAVVSCSTADTLAPVIDVNAYEAVIKSGALRPYTIKHSTTHVSPEIHPDKPVTQWIWPARGTISNRYSAKNKGIDIAGQFGEPIYAAASGRIVYAGNGLRGYGNLIIIKHNSEYLSAYAYNSILFVHEGEWVKSGHKIAEMGASSSDRAMLHFEIRRHGNPINPLNILH
jgi:lipoprotein NlpD